MSLPIMAVVLLALIAAYIVVIRFQSRYLLALIVVSAIAALVVGWLGFGYRSFSIPLQARLFPDRVHQGRGVSIPLPPHTVQSGRCSATGSYYYSRSTLSEIDQFYRSVPSAEPGAITGSKLEVRYGTSLIIAVQRSAQESQLAIDCPMHSSEPATDNPSASK